MNCRITRRTFAASTAALAAASLPICCPRETQAVCATGNSTGLEVRPYQLMCVVCRLGAGCSEDLGNARLTGILKTLRHDRKTAVTLRCNTDHVYRYQNPGPAENTPEGELFNAKRDLDILQKLGLVPGDTRPGIDLFERLLANVPTARGICGYEHSTSDTWRGCARAASGDYEKGCKLGLSALLPRRDAQEKAATKKSSAAAVYQAQTLRIRPHHLLCMSCFHGGKEKDKLSPLVEDNLFEAIEVIQKNPDIPVMLIAGTCMICPPCHAYDPESKLCLGGRSMALRDQKKDLDVLQNLGLKYGDVLPARKLYDLVYERIPSTRDICGFGDLQERAREWSICGSAKNDEPYRKARAKRLGIPG